jgi:hypothetical protein
MPYSLLVVEGAHDAAFFGQLLRQRTFRKIQMRDEVDPYWAKLIPTQFPADPAGRLDHVVKYPDIYESQAQGKNESVAILVANGDSRLIPEFQAALEILDVLQLRSASIVSDADDIGVPARLTQLLEGLAAVSTEGTKNSLPGFPLTLPNAPGLANGAPRIGIHIFPNNVNNGTLETILLDCASTSYSAYQKPAVDFVAQIDASQPAGTQELRALRRGAGRQKAAAGVLGNLLFPGYSLSVAVDRGSWLAPVKGNEVGLVAAQNFLDALLP